jgi:hypothetical protein
MAQFIAYAVSIFIALGLTSAAMMYGTSHQVQIFIPPPADGQPAGVSGGGPVGSLPISVPTPLSGNNGKGT